MSDSVKILKMIVNNVEKVIIGKRSSIELALISMICNGHVLVEDVPGVGKTSMVSAISKSISASFKRIQFTPDVLPSDITGFSMYNRRTTEFEFRPGSVMSNIILADEINRTSPKTQSSLLEAMDERQVTVDGITHSLPRPFMVLATQNPIEYLGTYPLPEAQLDRFFMKISLNYPLPGEESQILARYQIKNPLDTLDAVADNSHIIKLQEEVKSIYVDSSLNNYIVEIVNQTRKHPDITLGASPRGSLALCKAAQAWAFYSGRDFVIPEDIKKMVVPVLSHRIILKQEAKLKKITANDLLYNILNKVDVPVVKSI